MFTEYRPTGNDIPRAEEAVANRGGNSRRPLPEPLRSPYGAGAPLEGSVLAVSNGRLRTAALGEIVQGSEERNRAMSVRKRRSRRRLIWLLCFWGGTAGACTALAAYLVLLATSSAGEAYWFAASVILAAGFMLRQMAKRAVRSLDRGEPVTFELVGLRRLPSSTGAARSPRISASAAPIPNPGCTGTSCAATSRSSRPARS
nr:hypothetical protein GCM10025732_29750 [Glycomyces mayteni]